MNESISNSRERFDHPNQIEQQAKQIRKECIFEIPANMESKFNIMLANYFQKITPLATARQKESIKNNKSPESYDNLYRNIAISFINNKYKQLNLGLSPAFESSKVIDKKLKLSNVDLVQISLSLNILGETLKSSGTDEEFLLTLQNSIDTKLDPKERENVKAKVFEYVLSSNPEKLYCTNKSPDLKSLQAQTLLESLTQSETQEVLDKLLQKGDSASLQKFSQIAVYSSFPTPIAFKLIRKYKDKPAIASLEAQINQSIIVAEKQKNLISNQESAAISKKAKSTLKYTSSFFEKTSKNRLFLGAAYFWGLLTAGMNTIVGITTAAKDKNSSKTILQSALLTALGGSVAYGAGQALAGRENPYQDLVQKAVETFGYSKEDIDSMKSIQLNRLASGIINKLDSQKASIVSNDQFLNILTDKNNNLSKTQEKDAPETLQKFTEKLNQKNPKLATHFKKHYLKESLPVDQRPDPLVVVLELYALQKSFSHKEGGLVIQSREQFLKNYAAPNQMTEEDFPEISFA